jgi:hypothetical protein
MTTTEKTLEVMRREMRPLMEIAMEGVVTKARGVLEEADQKHAQVLAEVIKGLAKATKERAKALSDIAKDRAQGLADVAAKRAKGLAEVAEERAKGMEEVEAKRAEVNREREAMQMHQEAQAGHVVLNVGGYRYQTSVQTLRRVPNTFFDAYFSGRYAQDVCRDGSIFVDRDGKHFGHVLEYMRDGVVSMAQPGARPSVNLLRSLKLEFSFYCIDLMAKQVKSENPEVAYAMGGHSPLTGSMSSMERFSVSSGKWTSVAAMSNAHTRLGACVVDGELYVTGGRDAGNNHLSSVEKYSPSSDTWRAVAPLTEARSGHDAIAVGSDMYVLGGSVGVGAAVRASVLKFDSLKGPRPAFSSPPALSGARSMSLVGLRVQLKPLSSSTTRRPTSGLPKRPCPMFAALTAPVCWAVWPTSWGLVSVSVRSCASIRHWVYGLSSRLHQLAGSRVKHSFWAGACMLREALRSRHHCRVSSATTWLATSGRPWRPCSWNGIT